MSSVEDRVVGMHFDNKQFESGAKTTLSTLDKLKQALSFKGAQDGLSELSRGVSRFNLNPLTSSVQGVSKGFLAMSSIAITALANITNRAVDAGIRIGKSLTVDPILAGLHEYETNLNSIQTILANTEADGENIESVNAALQQLNRYSDKTIYNFSQMADNVKTFTAAGIDLQTSVDSIKGLSNVAALFGVDATSAARGMFQLSQAMASGVVRLQDWRSLEQSGLAGQAFQESLKETARVHGVEIDKMIKESGSFRDSLSKNWLTAGIMTETLSKFTGELSDKQLENMGYTKAQIKDIQKLAKTANDSATKVKTLSQLMDTLKEAAGSGWARSFQLIFGDLLEARKLFTGVNNVVGGFIQQSAKARNKVLGDWKELGGRTKLIEAIGEAFHNVMRFIIPIKNAFRDIFPAMTGERLFQLTKNFSKFVEGLKIGTKTMEDIRRTFRGVFAVFSILGQVIKGAVGFIGDFFGLFASARGGGILDFTGDIGDFLVAIDDMLKKGDLVEGFFDGIISVVKGPIAFLKRLAGIVSSLFEGFDAGQLSDGLGEISDALSPFERIMKPFILLWVGFVKILQRVGDILAPIGDMFSAAFQKFTEAIEGAFGSNTFDGVLDTINTGLLGGILLILRKFLKGGLDINLGGGFLDTISGTFGELTNTLKAMQTQLKADALIKIAGAIGIMALSLLVLSQIDSEDLTKALGGMAVGIAQLLIAMKLLEGVGTSTGFLKIPFIAGSLILLSTSILILTGALKILSTIDKRDLERGLLTIGLLLLMLTKAVKPLAANSAGMVTAGAGMILIATAMNIMAVAVKKFGEMEWEQIGKGLAGVGGGLAIIAGAMRLMPKGMVAQAAALVIIAVSLKVLASAIGDFAAFNWKQMGKGMAGIAGALLIVAGAMRLMPTNMVAQAAALVLVGVALGMISKAVKVFGKAPMEVIGQGLIAMGAALAILAGGLYLMTGSLAGAAALLVAAGALAILTPVLMALGTMSWEAIIKGMVTLAGAFTILGVAGLLLAPIVPAILGLGAALLLLGAGLALAGVGALAFATAFSIVVAAGTAGISVLGGMIGLIPQLAAKLAEGIIQFATTIAKNATTFVKAFEKLLIALLDAIIRVAPKIGKTFTTLLNTLLNIVVASAPRIFAAGFALLMALLHGIEANIGEIVNTVSSIIVKFLHALGDNIDDIIQAGFDLLIDFLEGIEKGIDENSERVGEAGADVAWALVTGVVNGLTAFGGRIIDKMVSLAQDAWNEVKDFWKIFSPSKRMAELGKYINLGLVKGLVGSEDKVIGTIQKMNDRIKGFLDETKAAIDAQKDKIAELRKAPKDETAAEEEKRLKQLDAHKQKLKELLTVQQLAQGAHKQLLKGMKEERQQLVGLSKEYDRVTAELEDAQQALQSAIDARDADAKSIADQFNQGPEISPNTDLDTYLDDIRDQTAATRKYFDSLQALRAQGLSDEAYQKLVDEGIEAQPFVDQIIAGGAAAVTEFNNTTSDLTAAAQLMGTTVANDMHAAGIAAAQGLVAGLQSQQGELAAQMEAIAKAMIKAIKKELKIKSPSRAFAEVGGLSGEGLAAGLKESSRYVEKASADLGDTALQTLQVSMSNVGKGVTASLDMTPIITPVLDLTQLQKDATQISSLLDTSDIAARVSYSQASAIAQDSQKPTDDTSEGGGTTVNLEYTQNINAPKSPNAVEVYRGTRNQLSLVKEALNSNVPQ